MSRIEKVEQRPGLVLRRNHVLREYFKNQMLLQRYVETMRDNMHMLTLHIFESAYYGFENNGGCTIGHFRTMSTFPEENWEI